MIWTLGFLHRLVKLADGLAFLAAPFAAWLFARDLQVFEEEQIHLLQSLVLSAMALLVYWQVNATRRTYRFERYNSYLLQVLDVVIALAGGTLLVLVMTLVFLPHEPRGGWLGAWFLWTFAQLSLIRLAVTLYAQRAVRQHRFRRRVVVLGTGERAASVIRNLREPDQQALYEIVGLFDPAGADSEGPAEIEGVPVSRSLDELERLGRDDRLQILVIALPWTQRLEITALLQRFSHFASDVVVPFDSDWANIRRARIVSFGDHGFLQLMRRPLRGSDLVLKAIEDYLVAGLALLLLGPLMLLTALAIRLDSPGPVLFRQPRLGFNGQTFTMLKFRTMTYDPTDDGTAGTLRDDPRVTRLGALLRRTSIDELPQLINVLKGEMSVVGPRAHVPGMRVEDRTYAETVQEYASRLRVKPGITGWAQINGMRGGIRDEARALRGVQLDLHYIENWSLWLDFRIMVRTVFVGLAGRDVF